MMAQKLLKNMAIIIFISSIIACKANGPNKVLFDCSFPDNKISNINKASNSPNKLLTIKNPYEIQEGMLLYIFDENSNYLNFTSSPLKSFFQSTAFKNAEKKSFWTEIIEDEIYQVPEIDKCMISSMISEPFSFFAPKNGVLLVQFVYPNCEECNIMTDEINMNINKNKTVPQIWVQINHSNTDSK